MRPHHRRDRLRRPPSDRPPRRRRRPGPPPRSSGPASPSGRSTAPTSAGPPRPLGSSTWTCAPRMPSPSSSGTSGPTGSSIWPRSPMSATSWDKRRETLETNLMGTFHLFEAVRRFAPKARILFVSSSDVYGYLRPGERAHAFREERPGRGRQPLRLHQGRRRAPERVLRPSREDLDDRRRPALSPHRAGADGGFRLLGLGPPDRPDRKRQAPSRHQRREPRAAPRLHRRPRRRPGLRPAHEEGRARRGLQRLLGQGAVAQIGPPDAPLVLGAPDRGPGRPGEAPESRYPPSSPEPSGRSASGPAGSRASLCGKPFPTSWNPGGPRYEPEPARRHVLVTGGAGYIGSLLCGDLLRRGFRVTVIDRLMFGGNSLLAYLGHPAFAFHQGRRLRQKGDPALFQGRRFRRPPGGHRRLSGLRQGRRGGLLRLQPRRDAQRLRARRKGRGEALRLRLDLQQLRRRPGRPSGHRGVAPPSPIGLRRDPRSRPRDTSSGAPAAPAALPSSSASRRSSGRRPGPGSTSSSTSSCWEAVESGKLVVYQKEYNRSFVHIRDVVRAVGLVLEAPVAKVRGEVFNVGSNRGNYSKEEIARLIRKYVPGIEVEYKDLRYDGDMRDVKVAFDKIDRGAGLQDPDRRRGGDPGDGWITALRIPDGIGGRPEKRRGERLRGSGIADRSPGNPRGFPPRVGPPS